MGTSSLWFSLSVAGAVAIALAPAACNTKEPQQSTYFERSISPILTTSCVRTNTGAACHVSTGKGNAFGNLDTSTFAGLNHRRDLLADYGPYGQPALLVKNVAPFQVEVQSYDGQKVTVTTDIKHTGGPILDPTATGYQTLRRWVENGATENNSGAPPTTLTRLPCTTAVPSAVGFDPAKAPDTGDFNTFRDRVNPIIRSTCAASNCHGTSSNDLYLTCGDADDQLRWNYFIASQYVAKNPQESEIVRRPLAPAQGGAFHEGGIVFPSTNDDGYKAFLDWATQRGPADFSKVDPDVAFFAHRVQPMLVKKGCMMLQCHSAAQFHDYRLRGGSGGSFSFSSTRKNYDLTLAQLSIESEDVEASRLVRKNLFRPEVQAGSKGLAHRGGPLLEDFGAEADRGKACDDKKYDYDAGPLDDIPAYCMFREWHKRERTARAPGPLTAIAYVRRPAGQASVRPQDFDVYRPGAELHLAQATMDAAGNVTLAGDTIANESCGLDKAAADIGRISASWDGHLVAFAARGGDGQPFAIYQLNADGTNCQKVAAIADHPASANGITIHDFDPAYSPLEADGSSHLVFASTRGNLATGAYDYSGPQRTPANPAKPNANLYVFEKDPKNTAGPGRVRQLTYNLNTERYPAFMSDGRVIFTAEKRAVGFYQLAARRMNLDGADYHPLLGQRSSIGYHEATQVVEIADKNFAVIFSDPGVPHEGGALGIFNRSLGIDFASPDAADYPIDPGVIDPKAPSSPEPEFFLHALRFPDGGANGHPGKPTDGVYTSPSPLPSGRILVSFGAASDAGSFGGDYDVYVMDPVTGEKTKLLGEAGAAEVSAVAVYGRASRGIFQSSRDEPNAFTSIVPDHAEADVTVLDMRVLASLLFQNTPTGRAIEDDISSVDVYEDLPPPTDLTGYSGPNVTKDEFGQLFVKRRLLGHVPLASDGSAHFALPGGVPISFKLPDTKLSRENKWPRLQRETLVFAPGEYGRQSFRRDLFDGLCAQCHGAVSGRPIDVAVRPDILTQASDTQARGAPPLNLVLPPDKRGQPEGP